MRRFSHDGALFSRVKRALVPRGGLAVGVLRSGIRAEDAWGVRWGETRRPREPVLTMEIRPVPMEVSLVVPVRNEARQYRPLVAEIEAHGRASARSRYLCR